MILYCIALPTPPPELFKFLIFSIHEIFKADSSGKVFITRQQYFAGCPLCGFLNPVDK
jgi:hypothetical protein